jgi:hypothetical protein
MKARSIGTTLFAVFSLTGCLTTQEMPLAPNVVRIDTKAGGFLFTGQTVPATMRAAANATLQRGYTHFKFAEAGVAQGSVATGAIGTSSYNSGSGISTVSVVHAPTSSAVATVVMFHADEPEAKNAFEAEQVLKQYQ